jgi:hypothetical protein
VRTQKKMQCFVIIRFISCPKKPILSLFHYPTKGAQGGTNNHPKDLKTAYVSGDGFNGDVIFNTKQIKVIGLPDTRVAGRVAVCYHQYRK